MSKGSLSKLIETLNERLLTERREYLATLIETSSSLILALLAGGIVLAVLGYDPLNVYNILFRYGFGNIRYLLDKSTPLMMTGLAFAIPLIAGLFNIGGESQLYIGAFIALLAAYYTHSHVIGILAGTIAGGLLGAFIGILRVYRGINEVISSIMVNWIFFYLIIYLISGVYYNPERPHESIPIPKDARIYPISNISVIFAIAVLASILYYIILFHTDIGYKMRVTGLSTASAKYAGFNPDLSMIYSMLLGGAAAGLGGALLVLGMTYSIDDMLSAVYGLGFTGIGIGLLGRLHPIGIILASIFFSGLLIGGQWVELKTGAPPELADTLIGVIVIALAIPYVYKLLVSRLIQRRVIE